MNNGLLMGAFFSLAIITSAQAVETAAKILAVGTYGSGELFIVFDTRLNEPGCAGNRVLVGVPNPEIRNWIDIALAAQASGQTIVIGTSGCRGQWPTMDTGYGSYLYVKTN